MAEISFRPPSVAITAVTVTNEVMGVPEFVMKALERLITQCPSSRTAVVRVAPASEPPPARPVRTRRAPLRRPVGLARLPAPDEPVLKDLVGAVEGFRDG